MNCILYENNTCQIISDLVSSIEDINSCVYEFRNQQNKTVYIGETKHPIKRLAQHYKDDNEKGIFLRSQSICQMIIINCNPNRIEEESRLLIEYAHDWYPVPRFNRKSANSEFYKRYGISNMKSNRYLFTATEVCVLYDIGMSATSQWVKRNWITSTYYNGIRCFSLQELCSFEENYSEFTVGGNKRKRLNSNFRFTDYKEVK